MHERGVCHRDLKPENLLLGQDGRLKVADFGLATVYRRGSMERTLSTICGSPVYMAPEVHLGRYHGLSVDIWSLGILLYVLITGSNVKYPSTWTVSLSI